MNRQEFAALFARGAVILDGATGSNLQAAGMPMGVCPEKWAIDHPEVVLKLQKEYVEAGSNIIYAPTFTANRIKLAEYGLEHELVKMNRQLVALSREAAGSRAYVAGDMSMTGQQLYPVGELQFEELVEVYKEQAIVLDAAGADLFVVETMMSLQECRAAVIAIKECSSLPILVSLTFEESGRTLFGTDAKTAAVVLQNLGVDAVGINCSTGPDKMTGLVEQMYQNANIPILVKPNAGLPKYIDGKTVYDMDAAEFAAAGKKLAETGARLLGGCCGTTPEHIRALKETVETAVIPPVLKAKKRILTSERKSVEIDLDGAFLVVGERINPTGKKKLQESLKSGSLDLVCDMAEKQEEQGAAVLDINMGMNGIDEKAMMLEAVYEVTSSVDCPLCIDSSHVDIIEAALRIYPGRALINSISLEKVKLKKLLPIAKKYGAMFILLPLSDAGLPKCKEVKHEIIRTIVTEALAQGLSKEDIIVDGLVETVGAKSNAALECLETIAFCKDELGLATVCGLSNISFGLPERSCVNTAFLTAAIAKGLTMAISNPGQDMLVDAAYAMDLLMNKSQGDIRYIKRMNCKKTPEESMANPLNNAAEHNLSENNADAAKVFECVLNGNKGSILQEVDKMLKEGTLPGTIINEKLIPAINKVGELFEKQIYFLPQLISSASAMQKAIEYLEPMLKKGENEKEKAAIIIATVEGDIHDIGKNLVVLMLKNYGYRVIDLGKDVSADKIVESAKQEGAKIIGLSALMTTTMMRMKDVVDLAKERGVTSKIIIGGAAATESFAQEIGADGYSKDAADCVKLVDALLQ